MFASVTTTVLLAVSCAQFAIYGLLVATLRRLAASLTAANHQRDEIRNVLASLPDRIISRSAGGVVGEFEVTLVGEGGREYVALPAGTRADLEALVRALTDGSVLIIVGANGAEHVHLPPGSIVYTAEQTIEMFLSSDLAKPTDLTGDV